MKDEEQNVVQLIDRISRTFHNSEFSNFEIVVTDNKSSDSTYKILETYAMKSNSRIKLIKHARDYGYQTSLQTCLRFSRGDYVAIMDGDLQDPPELIPEMLRLLISESVNIVYGIRKSRKASIFSKLMYSTFYIIWRKLADIDIQMNSGEFAVYDRFSVNQILKFRERNRFLRGIRSYLGLNQLGFNYDRDLRFQGQSKFSLRKQLRLAYDGIYSFSFAPIRLMTSIGVSVFLLSLFFSFLSVILKVFHFFFPKFNIGQMGEGLVQVFFLFTLLFGAVIIMLGVIGEYLSRIYDEIRDRPVIIEDTRNL